MDEIIRIRDQFYILASSLRAQTQSLKSGETFAVFDDLADIQPVGLGQQGLYDDGTRFLNRLELWIGDSRPLLLSSAVKEDKALVASGLARYMLMDAVVRIFVQLFDACLLMDLHRLPELYRCFARRAEQGPTRYPVACARQAWASAPVFAVLQACLGLTISASDNRVVFFKRVLPSFLESGSIRNLRVGESTLDIEFHRYTEDVGIHVAR